MIHAKDLTKRYGSVHVLDHVSFDIQAGEAVALWGANGAGKTTTLRCILGVQAFEGSLTVNSIDVRRHAKAARAEIGYVPQEAAFYDMTVWETLHFYGRLKKVKTDRVSSVLEQVQLAAHQTKRVGALSGGMKQRLALAVALLADPPILVLDEPTANLDVQAQRDFIHMIQSLNQLGKTIVFSSHRLDEVLMLSSRVLVLGEGKLRFSCTPSTFIEQLGLKRWLRIWVQDTHKEPAVRFLEAQGYTFSPNGHTVYVQVPADGKMALLNVLQGASIRVLDFELIEGELITTGKEVSHD